MIFVCLLEEQCKMDGTIEYWFISESALQKIISICVFRDTSCNLLITCKVKEHLPCTADFGWERSPFLRTCNLRDEKIFKLQYALSYKRRACFLMLIIWSFSVGYLSFEQWLFVLCFPLALMVVNWHQHSCIVITITHRVGGQPLA